MNIKPPKPRDHSGARDQKDVDYFLFDMEQYFRIFQLSDDLKGGYCDHSLVGRCEAMIQKEQGHRIWEGQDRYQGRRVQERTQIQFYYEITELIARMKLQEIRHKGYIRDYVKEYSTCILDISDMNEKFILCTWAARMGAT